jgi:hypothetical protein
MWDGDDGEDKGATPKQRLMHWIQSKVPDLPITNFTSDWNDGRAVGALVDAVAPGLCPDWQDWNPKDAIQNASEAMGLADDWLNIPQVRCTDNLLLAIYIYIYIYIYEVFRNKMFNKRFNRVCNFLFFD